MGGETSTTAIALRFHLRECSCALAGPIPFRPITLAMTHLQGARMGCFETLSDCQWLQTIPSSLSQVRRHVVLHQNSYGRFRLIAALQLFTN